MLSSCGSFANEIVEVGTDVAVDAVLFAVFVVLQLY